MMENIDFYLGNLFTKGQIQKQPPSVLWKNVFLHCEIFLSEYFMKY